MAEEKTEEVTEANEANQKDEDESKNEPEKYEEGKDTVEKSEKDIEIDEIPPEEVIDLDDDDKTNNKEADTDSTNVATDDTTRKELEVEIDERKISHEKLRSYEVCRRTSYKSKLNSSNLYWKSFRELMDLSVKETRRAVYIVRARVLADETYSSHMSAIYENMLETDGKAITDEKKKKKIITARESNEFKLHDSVNQSRMEDEAREKKGALLSQVVDCHEVLADRYEESAKSMKDDILPELEILCNQLANEVVVIEALGDTILSDLQAAEMELESHWDQYYTLASLSIDEHNNQYSRKAVLTNNFETELNPVDDTHDVWVAEMQYRMSVAFLSAFWEKCSAELSRIFATMKDAECSRRFRLRELLIRLLQKHESLWTGLPSVISPALKDLVDRPMDRPTIEDDVQTSIRMRAQAIQRSTKEAQPKAAHPGLSDVNPSDGNFELSSPLQSSLMSKAYVVEKKTTGMMSSWKTSLAVVTKDSYLHLFDIPSSLKVTCGSAPEVAFYALVPPVTAPTEESMKNNQASSKIKKWNVNLIPADSLALPNCRISFKDDGKNSAFEIVETILNTGASKVFGKISLRKLYLRTLTREDTVNWIQALSS